MGTPAHPRALASRHLALIPALSRPKPVVWSSQSHRTTRRRPRARAAAPVVASQLWPGASPAVTLTQAPSKGLDVPAPPSEREPLWCEQEAAAPLELRRQIFCNRSLNMKQIKAIGWDMDYTIAQYKPKEFEELAYRETVDKLVRAFGYPPSLYSLAFDYSFMMRGLIVDKKRGNVIKVDRHKYVKIAYHGFRALPSEERDDVYNWGAVRDEFDEPAYAMVDTLFSLAECYLFSQLVELADKDPSSLPHGAAYQLVWRDVRAAVDLCHRDGSLKREVAAHPSKYIHDDPHLVPMLRMYKAAGRKLFLATNSLWDYTNVVMNHLCSGRVGRDKNDDWLDLFDVVIVGCAKPGFFSERRPLFAVDPADGSLANTDGGAPIIPIDAADLPADNLGSTASVLDLQEGDKGRVFQGGNYVDLHKMLGITSGTECLYIGDHIYGDILRSKKSLGWRTMLVVPELERELEVAAHSVNIQRELRALREQRDALADQIERLEWQVAHGGPHRLEDRLPGPDGGSHGDASSSGSSSSSQQQGGGGGEGGQAARRAALESLRQRRAEVKGRHSALLRSYHESFHPVWGRLLKTGYQNSRYAHQMDRFACLYTSHVSNLAMLSPDRAYRGRVDLMAHEIAEFMEGGEPE
ncbi:MAG: purine 5'-nucleotidase [Monoraphidium minutum]|nr:MAG: purine 5'-nucleotidase [Monoraphidium minutum]